MVITVLTHATPRLSVTLGRACPPCCAAAALTKIYKKKKLGSLERNLSKLFFLYIYFLPATPPSAHGESGRGGTRRTWAGWRGESQAGGPHADVGGSCVYSKF